MDWLINTILFVGTFTAMEGVAGWTHRHVMHGWGWAWHRSHHQPTRGWFERNDLYAVVGAAVSIALIAAGADGLGPTWWMGWGMTAYGACYFIFHDGLVHQRWPLRWQPRGGYLKRLVQAHKMHHAVRSRDGCVSFGFLYAPPLAELKRRLERERASR